MSSKVLILFLVSGAFAEELWLHAWKRPKDFPEGQGLTIESFQNWANDINKQNVYTAYPKTDQDVVTIVNWARTQDYQVRASGEMHTWAPITIKGVKESDRGKEKPKSKTFAPQDNEPPKNVILVKTKNLNQMKITSLDPKNASFWAQPGILMDDVLERLEKSKLDFLAVPAPGDITLGGALAIGAHGTGVRAKKEVLKPGYTYGSMSNMVMEFTAVVFDQDADKYVLKTFQRSQAESSPFLVNVGRAFLTNVTMRVGALTYLRCQSFTNIPADELFRKPEEAKASDRTISYWLDKAGRMEVILFPFTDVPWFKVWTVEPEKPAMSRRVTEPYNYYFSDRMPRSVSFLIGEIQKQPFAAPVGGVVEFEFVKAALVATKTTDLWGPSRTVLNYIKPTTLLVTANGYAIHTRRDTVQKVLHDSYKIYKDLLHEYKRKHLYPINGPLEVRVTGVDDPADVLIPGAAGTGFSATTPSCVSGFDTVVWLDVLTYSNTEGIYTFMEELEEILYDQFNDRKYALMRVEWSKGWAYNDTASAPWSNSDVIEGHIPRAIPTWSESVNTLNNYDPKPVFMNEFLSHMFSYQITEDNGTIIFS